MTLRNSLEFIDILQSTNLVIARRHAAIVCETAAKLKVRHDMIAQGIKESLRLVLRGKVRHPFEERLFAERAVGKEGWIIERVFWLPR